MEAGFGRSFADVQAYSGPAAQRAAQALGAQAYTLGQRIAFRSPGGGHRRHQHRPEEGFATHFLQDCFAAGHMMPRMLDNVTNGFPSGTATASEQAAARAREARLGLTTSASSTGRNNCR
jgi:hypothetical protein